VTDPRSGAPENIDLGDYCRRVEEHLTRSNQGNLVRVVGVGFELVRQWALDGVPLSVVFRGIDDKAERHRAGRSTRPLRIEFCESDVRAVFAEWKRAIGVTGAAPLTTADAQDIEDVRRPSLSKHLERVVTALTRAAGRLDTPDALRMALTEALQGVIQVQEDARRLRGAARDGLSARLMTHDLALLDAARAVIGPDGMSRLRREAEAELSVYRTRMAPDAWERSVNISAERLVRDALGLPTLEP
jgi:hypothetical protein